MLISFLKRSIILLSSSRSFCSSMASSLFLRSVSAFVFISFLSGNSTLRISRGISAIETQSHYGPVKNPRRLTHASYLHGHWRAPRSQLPGLNPSSHVFFRSSFPCTQICISRSRPVPHPGCSNARILRTTRSPQADSCP